MLSCFLWWWLFTPCSRPDRNSEQREHMLLSAWHEIRHPDLDHLPTSPYPPPPLPPSQTTATATTHPPSLFSFLSLLMGGCLAKLTYLSEYVWKMPLACWHVICSPCHLLCQSRWACLPFCMTSAITQVCMVPSLAQLGTSLVFSDSGKGKKK